MRKIDDNYRLYAACTHDDEEREFGCRLTVRVFISLILMGS